MKIILQILFFFFTWFTNLNATQVFAKVALSNYELSFSKTENVKVRSEIKIGVQNFAWSGVLEKSFYQKSTLRGRYVLVRASRVGECALVQGAGNIFKVGDNIIGKAIQKVRTGTNGKVAVIGRRMPGHVEDVAAALKAEGKQVEIFSELDQKNNFFNINGANKSWDDIVADFNNTNGQYLTSNGRILDSELPKTMMYKANKIWVDKLKAQGYTVIDMGYPAGQTLPQSVFYDMELLNLFP